MKKAISIVLVAVVLAVVVGSFAACNLFKSITVDEAKANLEAAGYTVTVMTGADYAKSEENTYGIVTSQLESYLYAVKGEDAIKMFFFDTVDHAENNGDFIFDKQLTYSGQSNKVYYVATKQARKDAKV